MVCRGAAVQQSEAGPRPREEVPGRRDEPPGRRETGRHVGDVGRGHDSLGDGRRTGRIRQLDQRVRQRTAVQQFVVILSHCH